MTNEQSADRVVKSLQIKHGEATRALDIDESRALSIRDEATTTALEWLAKQESRDRAADDDPRWDRQVENMAAVAQEALDIVRALHRHGRRP